MGNYEGKYEVTFYTDNDYSELILIINQGFYSIFKFTDVAKIAGVDLTYGGATNTDRLDEYIKLNEKNGIFRKWTIQVAHLEYIYSIVNDWIKTGYFDIYDYYGERPWHLGGKE